MLDYKYLLTYVTGIIVILIALYYGVPWAWNQISSEDYAPDREKSDLSSDWDIMKAVAEIRGRQKRNLKNFSQRSDYGI